MKKVLKTALLCFLDVLLIFAIAALLYFGFNLRLTSLGIGILMFLFGYILKRIIFRDPQKRKLQKEKNKSIQKKIILQSIENNEQAPEKLSKNKANDFAEALNSGKSVKMSLSEIVDVIMDIDLAKKALPDSKFKEVYKLYNIYKHNTDKLSIDLSIYYEMVFEITKRFEAIAPFAQYSNLSESEISYIMDSNQVKAPTPQPDTIEEEPVTNDEVETATTANPEKTDDIEQKQEDAIPAPQDAEKEKAETTCPKCSKTISSEYEFCPHCGRRMPSIERKSFQFNKYISSKRLKSAKKDSKNQFFSNKTSIIISIIVALLFILMIVLVTIFSGIGSSSADQSEVTTAKNYSYYIGNKSTKVYHDPDCKYLPKKANQVKIQKNRSGLTTLNNYEPCWYCQPEPPSINN